MNSGFSLINEIDECVVAKGNMAFWWLGQLGYAVKLGDVVIYIDAFLSEIPGRNIPALLKPEEIVNADFIFGSHDHIDHIDRDVWYQLSLSSPKAKFIVPKLIVKELSEDLNIPENRFVGIDDGMSVFEGELKITGIAAAHEFLDQDETSGNYPYLGYVIEGNGCVFYHSGDTCIYEGLQSKLKKWDKFNVMFIPINGRNAKRYLLNLIGNMTYQEAVDLVGSLNPKLAVPGHYEMFTDNSENPLLFADYIDVKYPVMKYWIGEHGEMVLV
jgi:L-ascorbate metabolism protein UlaG (beta-lactamase superfamily)